MQQPVYEFRPYFGLFSRPHDVYRYADGNWLLDDGSTYDLAFVGRSPGGAPRAYFVGDLHQRIGWMSSSPPCIGVDRSWWHFVKNPQPSKYDWDHRFRSEHPNGIAGELAMRRCVELWGCANGRSIDARFDDVFLLAQLVRRVDTKEIFNLPATARCKKCGNIEASKIAEATKQAWQEKVDREMIWALQR